MKVELDRLERVVGQIPDPVDGVLQAVLLGLVDLLVTVLLQPGQVAPGGLLVGAPDLGDVGDELWVPLDRGVGDLKAGVIRAKGDADAALGIALGHDRRAGQHREQGGESLLAVHDQQPGSRLLGIGADLAGAHLSAGEPKQQVANGEALVHRVEQVADLGCRPHEGPLDVGQRDGATLDVVEQVSEVVGRVLEQGHRHW
jgi:hypothetical protein